MNGTRVYEFHLKMVPDKSLFIGSMGLVFFD